ncbi:lasso peptide isopeptide bond-forming cyclase [Streptomyces sp. JJ36]|uniref:lasso peptide isopeptide bond-forming cyclase n=1 Tax=Streptomyces sp. JJ36 TaxID=2736645 RepID=UPI001EED5E61|nr:lasso peptide isopeptide bond-forming cyclase [Streptomyces sp. JJ36]MCF6525626.1 lasso peptide isopeptide bond-forming cyclase [Streptomyces sp. JJ36]
MSATHVSARAGPGDAHFAVFPDRADAVAVARSFRGPGTRTLTHPSGRPWLTGHWHDDELRTARAGRAALAVVGTHPCDTGWLRRRAERLRDLAELDALARELPGSFHLAAVLDGRLRVQGTASGLRLVFHASVDGIQVAATSADVLAAALAADPDPERLALRLLWPVPHPLAGLPLWREVTPVAPEEALLVEADGRSVRRSRWWHPPEPVRSLEEGAPAVRDALTAAVGLRTRSGGVVSCDLSGGLDSTSVCFLAAGSPARLLAGTRPGHDPADSELHWARQAACFLPDAEHLVWDTGAPPPALAGLLGADDLLDEPTAGLLDRDRLLHPLPALRQRGSRLHLTGLGGDHVSRCCEAYYHGLLRHRPVLALRQLRGFRALWQWPLAGTARALADSRPYPKWLGDAARRLRDPAPSPVSSALGWGVGPRLWPGVTADAEHAVRHALREAAASAEPLHPDRGLHADLERIRSCTRVVRQWDRMAARAGVPMASPFFDDRVIEACLAVRPEDRVTPWSYKPLLTAAMRDVVPEACLRRANKAKASLHASGGPREHPGELPALWEDSRLERLGLVDGAALRGPACRPAVPRPRDAVLDAALACEVWLRGLTRATEAAAPAVP